MRRILSTVLVLLLLVSLLPFGIGSIDVNGADDEDIDVTVNTDDFPETGTSENDNDQSDIPNDSDFFDDSENFDLPDELDSPDEFNLPDELVPSDELDITLFDSSAGTDDEYLIDDNGTYYMPDRVVVRLGGTSDMSAFRSGLPDLGIPYADAQLLNPSADVAGIVNPASRDVSPQSDSSNQNNLYLLMLGDSGYQAVEEALDILNSNPYVEYAEPDYIYHLFVLPNDTHFVNGNQYALSLINAPGAWDTTTGSRNVVVGIIDTGILGTHTDLKDNLWINPNRNPLWNDINGRNFVTGSGGTPTDSNGHGTAVAGIIGAKGNNAIGVAGVNWDVSLAWIGIFDSAGNSTLSAITSAINYTGNHNIPITNNSYGNHTFSQALYDEIKNYNGLFVAAAGNGYNNNGAGYNIDTSSNKVYPATFNLPNIIAVASSDRYDQRASHSNYGRSSVHIAAPGVGIWTTQRTNNNAYESQNGTSMAAPIVAGVAALMLAANPNCSTQDLIDGLMNTVRTTGVSASITANVRSGGIVDAAAAVAYVLNTPPSAPQNLAATVGNGSIVLSWSAPANDGGHPVLRYQVSNNGGATWVNASGNSSHTFSGLTNYSSYTFAVRAVNAKGAGDFSSLSATPLDEIGLFITRLYVNVLGRPPEPGGFNSWVERLRRGTHTGAMVAYDFYFGPEFLSRNLSDEDYIRNLYSTMLDRAPDAYGWNAWIARLSGGMRREDVLADFIGTSGEFMQRCAAAGILVGDPNPTSEVKIAAFIARMYNTCLGRGPDVEGFYSWRNRLQSGSWTATAVARDFIFGTEFTSKNVNNSEFIIVLYRTMLGRIPNNEDLLFWLDRMNRLGWTKERVFNDFAGSREFRDLCATYGVRR